ncbi:MAG TPA: PspC domain-containing protein, partial [Prolixibacteraceae bacterium]|nr:PspC domain-containing protein [Prolixibacteraceae bacterium]
MQTIIVILSGVSFSLEHRAYEQLKAFIDKISLHYSGYSNQRAILIEVERRIASYFTTNRLPDSDIINESLVQNAIDSLGNSVYSFENVTADQQPIYNSVTNTSEPLSGSKLYRDTNSAIIGGVCSGLAQYLKTDKIIVRLLFVVFFIVSSGLGLLVYIILWIGMGKKSNILPPPASAGENNDLSGQRNFSQNLSGSASSENRYSQNVATEKPVKPSSFNKVIGFLLFAFGILNLAALITGFVFLSEVVDKLPQVFHPLAQDG